MSLHEVVAIFPGAELKLNLPSPLPSWVGPYWTIFIGSFDQKMVKITSNVITGFDAFGVTCPAEIAKQYFVSIESCPSVIHLDWLQNPGKTACDCSLAKILARGCQNPNHQ